MSFFYRLALPTRPVGRAYSSFFSSKPGSGRHSISAKPPKAVLQPGREKVDTTTATDSTTSPPANPSAVAKVPSGDENPTTKPHESQQSSPSLPLASTLASWPLDRPPVHPAISSKEYKLHHFFSLHRPLLLLNQPISTIFEAVDPSTPLSISEDQGHNDLRPPFATLDNPPESSPDADADAARQLAHTLVMNRVGGAVSWQQVLSQFGLSTKYSESDMTGAKETAQEWVTIHADSTRRKKRKKMKKHKYVSFLSLVFIS